MAYKDIVAVVQAVVQSMGYDCWGIQYAAHGRRALLQVFIDHPNGVSLDDCTSVSQQLSGVLDVEDVMHRAYILEVSSPGLERLLFKPEHYQRYIGKKIKLRLYQGINQRRKFTGIINAVKDDVVVMQLDEETMDIPFTAIQRARIVFDTMNNASRRRRG